MNAKTSTFCSIMSWNLNHVYMTIVLFNEYIFQVFDIYNLAYYGNYAYFDQIFKIFILKRLVFEWYPVRNLSVYDSWALHWRWLLLLLLLLLLSIKISFKCQNFYMSWNLEWTFMTMRCLIYIMLFFCLVKYVILPFFLLIMQTSTILIKI